MKQLEQFSTLLQTVYEGATNPTAWPDILAAVAAWLGAEKAALFTPYLSVAEGGFMFAHAITQEHLALYESRYRQEDLMSQRAAERGWLTEGRIILRSELVPDQELLASRWYREHLAPAGVFHILAGVILTQEVDCPMVACTYYRDRHTAPFAESHRQQMGLLVPHLSRALGVMFKLRDAEFRMAASLTALNQIHTGILLLSHQGEICFANTAAEQILRRQDGLQLQATADCKSVLSVTDPVAQQRLQQALHSALYSDTAQVQHFAQAVHVRRSSGLADYALQVSFLPESNPYRLGAVIPCAVVFIKDSAMQGKSDAALLQRVYGLTHAEARASLALCDGGSLDSVAETLNVQINTLKTHLKSIYIKTSVNSRSALTKLLLSLSSHRVDQPSAKS